MNKVPEWEALRVVGAPRLMGGKLFTEIGMDGWELLNVFMLGEHPHHRFVAIFKREYKTETYLRTRPEWLGYLKDVYPYEHGVPRNLGFRPGDTLAAD